MLIIVRICKILFKPLVTIGLEGCCGRFLIRLSISSNFCVKTWTSAWSSLYSAYWSLNTALYRSLSSSVRIVGYFLRGEKKRKNISDIIITKGVMDKQKHEATNNINKVCSKYSLKLTPHSLQWPQVWGCVQQGYDPLISLVPPLLERQVCHQMTLDWPLLEQYGWAQKHLSQHQSEIKKIADYNNSFKFWNWSSLYWNSTAYHIER